MFFLLVIASCFEKQLFTKLMLFFVEVGVLIPQTIKIVRCLVIPAYKLR
jgi:hypothetical protein